MMSRLFLIFIVVTCVFLQRMTAQKVLYNISQCIQDLPKVKELYEYRAKYRSDFINMPTIQMAYNLWTSHKLTSLISKTLIEQIVGCKVEFVENASYESVSSGDVHVNMEVWPVNKESLYDKYVIEELTVEDGGFIGYTGHNGWYVPSYVNEDTLSLYSMRAEYWGHLLTDVGLGLYPKRNSSPTPALDASKQPFCREDYCNSEGYAPSPPCKDGKDCPQFWHIIPEFAQGINELLMRNLKINMTINYLGERFFEELRRANRERQSIIFYNWRPSVILEEISSTRVTLPEYSPHCYTDFQVSPLKGDISCDFPVDVLHKVFWSELKNLSLVSYSLLRNIRISEVEMEKMIHNLANFGNSTMDSIANFEHEACVWLLENVNKWNGWIPDDVYELLHRSNTEANTLPRWLYPAIACGGVALILVTLLLYFRHRQIGRLYLQQRLQWLLLYDHFTEVKNDKSLRTLAVYKGQPVFATKLHSPPRNGLPADAVKRRSIYHTNIVDFIGIVNDVSVSPCNVWAVFEYLPKGSLLDLVETNAVPSDIDFKLSMARDIASGLQYLHSSDSIHGNLHPTNILVGNAFNVKLGGFGLENHIFYDYEQSNKDDGKRYWAPEKLLWWSQSKHANLRIRTSLEIRQRSSSISSRNGSQDRNSFDNQLNSENWDTKLSDVYSCGLILWTLMNGEEPFPEFNSNSEEIIEKIINDKFFPPIPTTNCPKESAFALLIKRAWQYTPQDRPSMDVMLSKFKQLYPENTSVLEQMSNMLNMYSKHLEELVNDRTIALEEEKKQAELLLFNILPRNIVERLRAEPAFIADSHEATIVFSDIVGFTQYSHTCDAVKLINMLNNLFTEMDSLASESGIEKIKTIGDAYMAACGVPYPYKDHVNRVALFALAAIAIRIIDDSNYLLKMRMGIHTGVCIAGVVGTSKFAYDLWGDTVNTASRMESNSIPGRICVSEAVYEKLQDSYTMEERDIIIIKGLGPTKTWLLGSAIDDSDVVGRKISISLSSNPVAENSYIRSMISPRPTFLNRDDLRVRSILSCHSLSLNSLSGSEDEVISNKGFMLNKISSPCFESVRGRHTDLKKISNSTDSVVMKPSVNAVKRQRALSAGSKNTRDSDSSKSEKTKFGPPGIEPGLSQPQCEVLPLCDSP